VSVCCGCNDCDNCLSSAYCCVNNQNVNIANGDGVANFTAALAGEVAITTISPLPDATVGNFYQIQFDASSCQPPFNWSATNSPSGLTLFSNGTLSGVPSAAGSNYFYVQVTDAGTHTTSKAFSLIIKTSATSPALGQPAKSSPTQFRFQLTGIAGQNYTIQRSTNLSSTNWSVLFVTNAPAASFFVIDPTATNGRTFYRALFGP